MKIYFMYFSVLCMCLLLSSCGTETQKEELSYQTVSTPPSESIVEEHTESEENPEPSPLSKEDVLTMRKLVLAEMSVEEITRLTENIKIANLRMESAYLNDNIFEKLSDKDSLYWNYFDQKGDIQIGWAYDGSYSDILELMKKENLSYDEICEKYGTPVIVYNRFDAANFISLIQDMQKSVHNELLIADLQQLIDLTNLATETHDMKYANEIYKILHDLDYFLLRYGIEDVGVYTKDAGIVATYYGVLTVYGATPFTETH